MMATLLILFAWGLTRMFKKILLSCYLFFSVSAFAASSAVNLSNVGNLAGYVGSDWTAYTPTLGADFGTTTAVSFVYRRIGDSLQVRGIFTTGTVTSGVGGISLPSGLSIDTNKISANTTSNAGPKVGQWSQDNAADYNGDIVTATSTSASVVYIANQYNNAAHLTPNSFGSIGFSSKMISVNFEVPISGWSSGGRVSSWSVIANIGGANPALSTGAVSSYTEITDSGLDLVLAPGSASAEIPCSSTNASSGLTCSSGSEGIGIVFTPPEAGTYEACATFMHYSGTGSSGQTATAFQWVETSNTAQTIIQEGLERQNSIFNSGTTLNAAVSFRLCGTFVFSSVSKRTLRVMYEQAVSGTINGSTVYADRSSTVGQRDIKITVRKW
jgi:hypothetical protein